MINATITFNISGIDQDSLYAALQEAVDCLITGGNIDYQGTIGFAENDESGYEYKVDKYSIEEEEADEA